jgi:hypothetical protein
MRRGCAARRCLPAARLVPRLPPAGARGAQGGGAARVDVTFTEFELQLGGWSTRVPLSWVKAQVRRAAGGWPARPAGLLHGLLASQRRPALA